MNDAWADGAPAQSITQTGLPRSMPSYVAEEPWANPVQRPSRIEEPARRPLSVTEKATQHVSRIRQFEGLRGYSVRATLVVRYINYMLLILLLCGITGYATRGVRYAAGGGTFMLFSCAVIAGVGAGATLFYANLRIEIVERVRHYIFGIILIPGTMLALILRALQEWAWVNEGSLGTTLQAALPAVFLATVVLPALVFVKEMLGIKTLHRSKMDDEEAVHLWTRQDGRQR